MRKAIVLGVVALFMSSGAVLAECGGHSTSASTQSEPVVTGSDTAPEATTKDSKS